MDNVTETKTQEMALDALQKAGMDWEVEKQPTFLKNGNQAGFAVVRKDIGISLGACGEDYELFQNRTMASMVDRLLGDAAIEKRAGMFKNGKKVYIQAKLSDVLTIGPGDAVEKYLTLTSSHDGSSSFLAFLTSNRLSCMNSLLFAIRFAQHHADESEIQSARHTKNMAIQVGKIQENLALINQKFGIFQESARAMLKVPMSLDGLRDYIGKAGLIPTKESLRGKELSGKSKIILEEVSSLFEHGKGQELPGVRGSLYAGLQAVTEYTQWHRSSRGEDQESGRLESSLFGSGFRIQKDAWQTALELVKA